MVGKKEQDGLISNSTIKKFVEDQGNVMTDDPSQAIYLLTDGSMISGSDPEEPMERSYDHRMIEGLPGIDLSRYDDEFWAKTLDKTGMVLLTPETKMALTTDGQHLNSTQQKVLDEAGYTVSAAWPAYGYSFDHEFAKETGQSKERVHDVNPAASVKESNQPGDFAGLATRLAQTDKQTTVERTVRQENEKVNENVESGPSGESKGKSIDTPAAEKSVQKTDKARGQSEKNDCSALDWMGARAGKALNDQTATVEALEETISHTGPLLNYGRENRSLLMKFDPEGKHFATRKVYEAGGLKLPSDHKLKSVAVFKPVDHSVNGKPVEFEATRMYSAEQFEGKLLYFAEGIAQGQHNVGDKAWPSKLGAVTNAFVTNHVPNPIRQEDPLRSAQSAMTRYMVRDYAGITENDSGFKFNAAQAKAIGDLSPKERKRVYIGSANFARKVVKTVDKDLEHAPSRAEYMKQNPQFARQEQTRLADRAKTQPKR
ncbi:hypothetical protein [Furfurilactobacillus rossiae]|uniref:Uncharacterized protein n=1 Tax=Furfurilactobacillus rossiae DSM 15814 TaxID=1114972 RepID=A0A0R1RK19_9LACO|nr:hypothetical protein [Furfurilactobacillus rossiae]KRL54011.1 hypothetical protein FD35_GL000714 [Furfurilactobacillus rossiae DSM 15814]QFR68161.1 hypothetical protein LR814_13395 [Furfurilactobacillus rossiae]QLE62673.1 hypothetical protein LROSRS0_p10037 [Furfurilactobacillus rossiae]